MENENENVADIALKADKVGNSAAMREACAKMRDLLMLRGNGKTHCILSWDEFNESQKMLRAALSAPARNCDLFACYSEAANYWHENVECADVNGCFDVWLFEPAAERKGEGDGR